MSAHPFVTLCRSQPVHRFQRRLCQKARRDLIVDIFLQSDGVLRPGWRFLFYVLIALALFYFFGLTGDVWRQLGVNAIWRGLISEASLVIAAFLPAVIMARLEGRTFADYGFPPQRAFRKFFWIGGLWGFASLTLLLLVLRASSVFYFGGIALHGVRILKFALFYALYFILVSFFEEFLFRGYTLYTGSTSVGFWPSAVIFSLLFGGVHLMNSGGASRSTCSGGHRALLLPHGSADWRSLVCDRLSHFMELGAELPLFGA